jgi:hypothetical protein
MNSVMADDELDELYWVTPEKFTATRSRLAAAAKERGDADSTKRVRCPQTHTAASVVNRLVLSHAKGALRLTDLGEQPRAVHAAAKRLMSVGVWE